VLNAIYEEDFLGFSYGFRPKRSPHDALDALVVGIYSTRVNYIFDADLRRFFDSVSQEWLIRFLEHRINDGRIIRLIQKWLKAGVLEDGARQGQLWALPEARRPRLRLDDVRQVIFVATISRFCTYSSRSFLSKTTT
jgi:hypothetical protein